MPRTPGKKTQSEITSTIFGQRTTTNLPEGLQKFTKPCGNALDTPESVKNVSIQVLVAQGVLREYAELLITGDPVAYSLVSITMATLLPEPLCDMVKEHGAAALKAAQYTPEMIKTAMEAIGPNQALLRQRLEREQADQENGVRTRGQGRQAEAESGQANDKDSSKVDDDEFRLLETAMKSFAVRVATNTMTVEHFRDFEMSIPPVVRKLLHETLQRQLDLGLQALTHFFDLVSKHDDLILHAMNDYRDNGMKITSDSMTELERKTNCPNLIRMMVTHIVEYISKGHIPSDVANDVQRKILAHGKGVKELNSASATMQASQLKELFRDMARIKGEPLNDSETLNYAIIFLQNLKESEIQTYRELGSTVLASVSSFVNKGKFNTGADVLDAYLGEFKSKYTPDLDVKNSKDTKSGQPDKKKKKNRDKGAGIDEAANAAADRNLSASPANGTSGKVDGKGKNARKLPQDSTTKKENGSTNDKPNDRSCFNCGESGHLRHNCPHLKRGGNLTSNSADTESASELGILSAGERALILSARAKALLEEEAASKNRLNLTSQM